VPESGAASGSMVVACVADNTVPTNQLAAIGFRAVVNVVPANSIIS
jgi:hypothetical protein